MSLWDKVKNALFEEEEFDEDELDETFEEIAPKKEKVKEEVSDHSNIFKRSKIDEEEVSEPKVEGIKKFDIKADDVKAQKQEKEAKPVARQRYSALEKKDYDIPEVVSPIFGLNEEDMKELDEKKIIKQKKSPKHGGFGEVISPYFGESNKSEAEEEDINLFGDSKKVDEVVINTKENDEEYQSRHELVEDEDVENISLENMIDDNDDGLIQFSLFGSDKVIKEEEYTRELNLKETEKEMDNE